MSKELEALSALRSTINLVDYQDSGQYYDKMKWLNIFEQALIQKAKQDKILDILKKKTISNFYIQWTKNYKDYNEFCDGTDYAELTQEEYDLLKEWLKDD